MGKTVQSSKRTEWKGLDRIAIVVHQMGNIWREMTKDDFGLDGEIEVVTPKLDGTGSETTGGIVKVQAKAGERYVRFDSPASFSSPVDGDDLNYWNSCTFPVLYVVYHPKDDKLYYQEVKAYIQQSPGVFAKPHQIKFDKTRDEFTASARPAVSNHAKISPDRISFTDNERLFSNLLPVKSLPENLYHAATRRKSWKSIRESHKGYLPPYCVVDGKRLFSLSDPTAAESPLNSFCSGRVETVAAATWLTDELRTGDFVFLMKQLLGKHMVRCGLRYNPNFKRNYFPRENSTDLEFRRLWKSSRTGVTDERIAAKYYEYGTIKFWRHLACQAAFCHFGSEWFLEIAPKYFFTTDGETAWDSELVGPYTTRLKSSEHNNQVLNHVLFWAYTLAQGGRAINLKLDGSTVAVIDPNPLTGLAHFAIPDDPATFEDKPVSQQLTLFAPDGDEDED